MGHLSQSLIAMTLASVVGIRVIPINPPKGVLSLRDQVAVCQCVPAPMLIVKRNVVGLKNPISTVPKNLDPLSLKMMAGQDATNQKSVNANAMKPKENQA